MDESMDVEIEYIRTSCYHCEIIFFLSEQHFKALEDSGNTVFCPNGHKNWFHIDDNSDDDDDDDDRDDEEEETPEPEPASDMTVQELEDAFSK